MMGFFGKKKPPVRVTICRGVLEAMFDECDKYDADETGGKVIGTYKQRGKALDIHVTGMIEPGPGARRTATSFFQDGEYQEGIFRKLEQDHPGIEHLGSWHTHHVNGLQQLSSGDIATYTKTVNHPNHNTNFFYAALIVEKVPGPDRYRIKHYLLKRDDATLYEIPEESVVVVNEKPAWPAKKLHAHVPTKVQQAEPVANAGRNVDKEIFSDCYPGLKPFLLKSQGVFYWKGKITLVNDDRVELIAMESGEEGEFSYQLKVLGGKWADLIPQDLLDHTFPSARAAVVEVERTLNKKLFLERFK